MACTASHFDPKVVEIFVTKVAPYPVGTCVRLSNGNTAIVTENYGDLCMRPKVRVFMENHKHIEPYEIKLSDFNNLNITVVEIV